MSEAPIDILALTGAAFVEEALRRGVPQAQAMEAYRTVFREGRINRPDVRVAGLPIAARRREEDTTKFTLRLRDGLKAESVLLPQRSRTGRLRHTLCVSSQIGCAIGCTFCETAQMGLLRNLTAGEIVAQWHAARFALGTVVSNIVFMGMGEPMDNLDAVMQAIRVLGDHNGPAIPASRISVSTAGRPEGIARLAEMAREDGFHRLHLAVSINAPNDAIRSQLMPINRAAPMAALMEAMLGWPARDRSRALIEYVLIPGVNDAPAHAEELALYLQPLACTVNVIPHNPRRGSPWPAPEEEAVGAFVDRLIQRGVFVKRRRTTGRSIMGACGQLGNQGVRRRRAAPTVAGQPDRVG